MIKPIFQKIQSNDELKQVIQSAFDVTLDVQGGWGYSQDSALIINETNIPLMQLQHTLASMRAHLEMNMTLPKEKRYAAINLNEIKREELKRDAKTFEIVTFEITAILEERYAAFIQEYKEGQDSVDFDLAGHFARRKEETLTRTEVFWFELK